MFKSMLIMRSVNEKHESVLKDDSVVCGVRSRHSSDALESPGACHEGAAVKRNGLAPSGISISLYDVRIVYTK